VVDREIAKRMRAHEGGHQQQHRQRGRNGHPETGAMLSGRCGVTSHTSEGTWPAPRTLAPMSRPETTSSPGAFITIDGPDGGGKTTQAERLRDHLVGNGVRVLLTREPGGTWLGERLREVLLARTSTAAAPTDPLTDALLFSAARRQIVEEVIRPAIAAGTTVICARFADSTLAYQGYGADVPLDRLRALADVATDGLAPDLTILLDLPVEAGLARKAPDDVTRFEAEFDLGFHRRVRDGFLTIARAEPERVAVIDATADMDTVAVEIASVVDRRLGVRTGPRSAGGG
jgi:dTMP kinase